MSILDAISPGSTVALDTLVWIYEFEANAVFGRVTNVLFRDGFGTGQFRDACSRLCLGELLVQPLAQNRPDLADRYRQIMTSGPDLTVWEVRREIIETAASLCEIRSQDARRNPRRISRRPWRGLLHHQ